MSAPLVASKYTSSNDPGAALGVLPSQTQFPLVPNRAPFPFPLPFQ
ncbi:MAG: hypothetical protein ACJ8F1_25120 [Polyangia bacterium]